MTTVFLSYARGDDEPFVKRLYGDLTGEGFDVWWDRVSMPSRQLTFHQKIKDAIRLRDRLVYVAGSKAAVSDYVREEWKFALECDKPVIPILRLGDFDVMPNELSLLHCEDFRDHARYREQLAKLVANLKQPEPPMGKLFAVPSLPPYFLGRRDILQRLRDAVRIDLQKPVAITDATSRVGLQGMGGIGKSVLAAVVARNREARRSYPDGVIWVTFGQHPDVAQLMRDVARHLGDQGAFENVAVGKGVLRDLLLTRAVMLVLDDVWKAADAEPFDILGPRCRALIITRDVGILHTLHGELYPVDLFTKAEALSLLAAAVEKTPDQLPPEALEIVRECGCLPLAVTLCGGMAKKSGEDWSSILLRLRHADLEKIADRHSIEEQHRSIWRAMQVSVEALEPDERERFAELSVFVTDQTVPESAVAALWAQSGNLDELDTEELLINLGERALIQLEKGAVTPDGKPELRFSLHDRLHDYAARTVGDTRDLHGTLLDGYRRLCPDGWHTGPNDGYFFRNICHHLVSASGNWDEAAELLCDLRFVQARYRFGEVFELQADYVAALEGLTESQPELNERRRHDERIARWNSGLIAHARAWNDARGQYEIDSQKSSLPEIIPSVRRWTDEEIEAETRRIVENPTRLDRVRAFARFVASEAHDFIQYSALPMFCIQQAYNSADTGPVAQAARMALELPHSQTLLLRTDDSLPKFTIQPACVRTLEGHAGYVTTVSIITDGRRAISGSDDNTLRIWDLETGRCIRALQSHGATVHALSVTADGRRAVTGCSDHTLRVWDLETARCLQVLEGHGDGVSCVSATPDASRAVSGSRDHTLRVWDLETGCCIRVLEGHTSAVKGIPDGYSSGVNAVSVTPDGRKAISGGSDKTLRVWDLETGQCIKMLEGHADDITCVSVTPEGSKAVSAGYDSLRLWDLETGCCTHVLEEGENIVRAVCITPDGSSAVSGGTDDAVRIWDLKTGRCVQVLEGHGSDVSAVSITPDGRMAVTGSYDKTLRLWDLEKGRVPIADEHDDWFFEQDARFFYTNRILRGRRAVSYGGLWDLETGCELTIWTEGGGHLDDAFSITPDGSRTVSGFDICSKYHDVLDVRDWKTRRTVRTVRDVSCHVVIPGGRRVAWGSRRDGILRVSDLETGCCIQTLEGHRDRVNTVSVLPDGKRAVSGSSDKTLRIWSLETGRCVRTLEGHTSAVQAVNVTPDGRRAVSTGRHDGMLRVWDLKTGSCIRTLEGHGDSIDSVSVLPDGRSAVSGSSDKTLRVWDLETGGIHAVFSGTWDTMSLSLGGGQHLIVGKGGPGDLFFLHQPNISQNPAILTVSGSFTVPESSPPRYLARCPACGKEIEPGQGLNVIIESLCSPLTSDQSPCLDLPDDAFSDPRLFSDCAHCGRPIRFNPFLIRPSDYEESLRRSLEHTRREKGEDHEDVLGHIEALIGLLEKTGRHDETRPFARERDRFVFRRAARNAGGRPK